MYHGYVLAEEGMRLGQAGDSEGAVAAFERAEGFGYRDPAIYLNRALARWDLNDMEGVVADATRFLEFEPGNYDVRQMRGSAKGQLGDIGGAIADVREALRLAPADWEAREEIEQWLNSVEN